VTRRLILAALAIIAILSLESCGLSRAVSPTADAGDHGRIYCGCSPILPILPPAPTQDPDQLPTEGGRAH